VEELMAQVRLDSNLFNRIEAMRLLTDLQRLRLMQDPQAEIDSWWLEIYGEILKAVLLQPALKAYCLKIDEQPLDRLYSTWYNEQVASRDRLMTVVNRAYRSEFLEQFFNLDTNTPRQSPQDGIEARFLKSVLLELIAIEDSSFCHQVILKHYREATTANDRVQALVMLNRSSAPERLEILEEAYMGWHRHLSGYANYLRVISSGTCNDVFDLIEREKRRPSFDITHPTWSRALLLPMAGNTRMLWTDNGIQWLMNTIIEMATINATTAGRLLNAFQHASKLKPLWREKVFSALEEIQRMVPDTVCPAINRQARDYLEPF
jgi:aminopeptidase N